MIFTFNPLRTFIEVVDPDGSGYGLMTTSMLDPDRTVPFLRYQTGDIMRLLGRTHVTDVARRHGVPLAADLPQALLALRGREREALPNGSHVGFYKDALYVDHLIARLLTGAFRTTFAGEQCTMHVQLASSQIPPVSVEQSILQAMPSPIRPARLVLWPYARFPFGMTLDYERKFVHYVPGEQDPCADGHEPRMRESPR
jgi:phenylacetate-CoA ligase